MRPTLVLLSILLPAAAYLLPPPARAAQSYDSCTGFIDSLPAVISTQGTWCLRRDLTTAMTSGSAIHINANNVTIDCNDFKIGGLAAGSTSLTVGIRADGRQNATVRHCGIRGFQVGIHMSGTGHVVEDNRLDRNLVIGIDLIDSNALVRRNRVFDTGGHTQMEIYGIGIVVGATSEVTGNLVIGVSPSGNNPNVAGIKLRRGNNLVRGNLVRGLHVVGTHGRALGIEAATRANRIEGNDLAGAHAAVTIGIYSRGLRDFCGHNTISGFQQALEDCIDTGGNVDF